jgi:hypothetical protein
MKQVEIYRAANTHEAQVLKNLLENDGIHAFISNEGLLGASDLAGWEIEPKVMVSASDVESAIPIVDDFAQQVFDRRNRRVTDADEDDIETKMDWPRCPNCNEPRAAICPGCQSMGCDFGEAVFVETESVLKPGHGIEYEIEPEQRMLMCTVCDRPFQPVYRKTCLCNYEFPDGMEFDQTMAEAKSNLRATLIWIALVAVAAFGCIYFWQFPPNR